MPRTQTSNPRETLVPWLDLAAPRDESHRPRVSHTIDTEAAYNVAAAFQARGHVLGRSLYNHPPEPGTPESERLMRIRRPLGPGVRLIRAGRPALHEDRGANRRTRKLGHTEIEVPFHALWRPVFPILRRNVMVLAQPFRDLLPPEFQSRGHVEFLERQGSRYTHVVGGRRAMPKEPRTAVFLLNKPDFFRGASLTSFFGPCGLTGLIFSLMLRERHSDWLRKPGLRMVELICTKVPRRTEDLGYTDAWQAVSVFHTQI
jgi:hypothetical protein